jgi:hypothetical protein
VTNLQRALVLLTSPQREMTALAERPSFWFPLLLTLLATLAIQLWYFQIVDFS